MFKVGCWTFKKTSVFSRTLRFTQAKPVISHHPYGVCDLPDRRKPEAFLQHPAISDRLQQNPVLTIKQLYDILIPLACKTSKNSIRFLICYIPEFYRYSSQPYIIPDFDLKREFLSCLCLAFLTISQRNIIFVQHIKKLQRRNVG